MILSNLRKDIIMDVLKKIFPHAFATNGLGSLIVRIIIYVIIGAVAGFLIGILAKFPIINIFTGVIGSIVELYVLGGVILSILVFLKIVK